MKALLSNTEPIDMPDGERTVFERVTIVVERKKS